MNKKIFKNYFAFPKGAHACLLSSRVNPELQDPKEGSFFCFSVGWKAVQAPRTDGND